MLVGHGGSPVILGLRKRRQRISRASWLANIWCIGEFWVQLREPDSMKKVESNSRRLGALHMSISVQEQTHAHVPTHIWICTPMLLCTTHICLEGGNISVWVSNSAMMGKLWLVGMVTKLSRNMKVECDQWPWAGVIKAIWRCSSISSCQVLAVQLGVAYVSIQGLESFSYN